MPIQIGDNFQYRGKKPLDNRNSFDTTSEMKSYLDSFIDEGHISYCKETNKHSIQSSEIMVSKQWV